MPSQNLGFKQLEQDCCTFPSNRFGHHRFVYVDIALCCLVSPIRHIGSFSFSFACFALLQMWCLRMLQACFQPTSNGSQSPVIYCADSIVTLTFRTKHAANTWHLSKLPKQLTFLLYADIMANKTNQALGIWMPCGVGILYSINVRICSREEFGCLGSMQATNRQTTQTASNHNAAIFGA